VQVLSRADRTAAIPRMTGAAPCEKQ